jgi:hypothetical protein
MLLGDLPKSFLLNDNPGLVTVYCKLFTIFVTC